MATHDTMQESVRLCNLPYPRNWQFVGREDLLAEIRQTLLSSGESALIQSQALTGLGGVGKTQTALEYAYRYAHEYEIVWWVRAETPLTLTEDLVLLAIELGLAREGPTKEEKSAQIIDRLRAHLGERPKCLLVFDNAPGPAAVYMQMPRSQRGHVIFTSRNAGWRDVAQPVSVPVLPRQDAVRLLAKRSGRTPNLAAEQLASVLGDLPLALVQAAAYIEQRGSSFSEYLELLSKYSVRLLEKGPVPGGYDCGVAATWALSLDQARTERSTAMQLLRLCSLLDPSRIPIFVFEHCKNHDGHVAISTGLDLNEDISLLLRYSLMERDADALSVHRLVQLWVRDGLAADDRHGVYKAGLEMMLSAFSFDVDEVAGWPRCAELLPHIVSLCQYAREAGIELLMVAHLLFRTATFQTQRGALTEAKDLYQIGLEIRQAHFAPGEDVANSLHALAGVLELNGELQRAKELEESALRMRRELMGSDDHSEIAESLARLGAICWRLGDLPAAAENLESAIAILTKREQEDLLESLAAAVHHLAMVCLDQAKHDRAEELLRQALALHRRHFDEEPHPRIAATLHELARVEIARAESEARRVGRAEGIPAIAPERLANAEVLLQESLRIHTLSQTHKHPNAIASMHVLARVLLLQKRNPDARDLLNRIVEAQVQLYGSECHAMIAESLHEIAVTYVVDGNYVAAREFLERVLRIEEIVFGGRDHHSIAMTERNLAMVLTRLGDKDSARSLLAHALATSEKALGCDHPNTVALRDRLADLG